MTNKGTDRTLIQTNAQDRKPFHSRHDMKFEEFLKGFVPELARKSKMFNQAYWLLETSGSEDAADLKAELDTELKMLFNDPITYQNLLLWEETDPILKRELNVLIRSFKQHQISKELLEKISQKEAKLSHSYAQFRPLLDGKKLTENDIREILKNEDDPNVRKRVWEASKEIGAFLAPQILELVHLRNSAAQSLGFSDYFQMQLELQEVDAKWLLATFRDLAQKSEDAYEKVFLEIEERQKKRFKTQEIGPWAWSDPFCQEDPLDVSELDQLVKEIDIVQASLEVYKKMGFDVSEILKRSDMFEREGKCQHAFCINIDRKKDVRTLNNVRPTIKWFETVLHELGHAVYELGLDESLPWLLREPPHMITTEAMALFAGRLAYRTNSLAEQSLRRRQLIFSRWVLVITEFESELYRDPSQNLSKLWWDAVEKYQKISRPQGRENQFDWAAKYHIGLAPVYYFSYLVGEMLASALQESIGKDQVGHFLQKKLFSPGNRLPWNQLIVQVIGKDLTPDSWVKEFAT